MTTRRSPSNLMLSQCPQCRAIFNVTEPAIEAHHGLVRCGHCRAIFHAVTNEVSGLAQPGGPPPAADGDAPSRELDAAASGSEPQSDISREADEPAPGPHTVPEPKSVQGPEPESVQGPEPESVQGAEPFSEPAPFPKPEPPRDAEWPPPDPDWERALDLDHEPDADLYAIPDDEWTRDEPSLPAYAEEAEAETPTELPGEIAEEILIEAPPTIAADFDAQFAEPDSGAEEEPAAGESRGAHREPAAPDRSSRETHAPAYQGPASAEDTAAASAPLKSPYRARDVRMVELPQPRPFKTATLSLLAVFLVLLLIWQVRTFYLDELAQVPLLRPYLEQACRPLGCSLPPRRDFARIELVGTSISIDREVPGALEIKAELINQAHFPQPYPPLRVTLTDREGRIVGRRTYMPGDYRPNADNELLPSRQQRDVTINLASPERDVVGYEVELVTPSG